MVAPASDIDPGVNRALAGRQAGEAALGLLAGRFQRQRVAFVVERNEPAHRERQRRRGEGAPLFAPEAPIVDVIGERRRNARRRMKQRDDGAGLGIAADRVPGGEIIDENDEEADAADDPLAVVEQIRTTTAYSALGGSTAPAGSSATTVRPSPGASRRVVETVSVPSAPIAVPIGAARAEAAGEGGPAHRARAAGKMQAIGRVQNREAPEIAGDVPVELGLAVEPADLPAGAVVKDISVVAGRISTSLSAGIDADDAVRALGVIGLRPAVAHDAEQAEGHLAQRAAGVAEGERKVAIDAVPHLAAFRLHAHGFGDGEFAVLGDLTFEFEILDDFGGICRRGGHAARRASTAMRQRPLIAAPERPAARRARRRPRVRNSRAAQSRTRPAIRLLGKDCTSTLRLRTVPL